MIKTENLEIVPLDERFSEDIFKLWGDYEVIKYTYSTLLKTPEECHERLIEWLKIHKDKTGPNKFAILLKGKMIGIVGYPVIDNDIFKCGIFYQIMKPYWGKGYAYEAAKAIIFYIYQLHTNANIIADAVTDNPASVKILMKLGFLQTNIQEKGFKNNGMELDVFHFEMTKEIFEHRYEQL